MFLYKLAKNVIFLIFIGKLRSNFIGTEFHIYDTGENPKKARYPDQVRKELGVITYDTNFFGAKGPRKMKVNKKEGKRGNRYQVKNQFIFNFC